MYPQRKVCSNCMIQYYMMRYAARQYLYVLPNWSKEKILHFYHIWIVWVNFMDIFTTFESRGIYKIEVLRSNISLMFSQFVEQTIHLIQGRHYPVQITRQLTVDSSVEKVAMVTPRYHTHHTLVQAPSSLDRWQSSISCITLATRVTTWSIFLDIWPIIFMDSLLRFPLFLLESTTESSKFFFSKYSRLRITSHSICQKK